MTRMKLPYIHEFLDRHGTLRRYVRRPGFKRVPLHGLPGSEEFMQAYQAALSNGPTPIGSSRIKAGTVAALVARYVASPYFKQLAPETRRVRLNILDNFRRTHGDKRVAMLAEKHVRELIAAKAKYPAAAKNFLKVLRGLLRFAVEIGMRGNDPTAGVKAQRYQSDGFATWSEADIQIFEERHPIGTRARLALALLLYTAQRRSDVVRMGRQHIRIGVLHLRQQKTGAVLKIPVHPALQSILDATPGVDSNLTFLTTHTGKPFSPAGFTNLFRSWVLEAGLLIGLSAHGLRKAAARRLAESGCTTHQMKAITGHRTLSELERYTNAADQQRLAESAMATVRVAFPGLAKTEKGTDVGNPREPKWQTKA